MEWMIKCRNRAGAGELRQATLPAHTRYLDGFRAETWFSGPMISDDGTAATGSFRLIDLPSRAAARRYIDEDPYALAGLFEHIEIVRLRRLTKTRQLGYAQHEGNQQYVAIGHLSESGDPDDIAAALAGFVSANASALLACGPLLDDEGETASGVLTMLDVPSRSAAMRACEADPLARGERYRDVTMERWRFGHV